MVEPTKFQAPQAAGSAGIREASRWSTTVLQERESEGQDPVTIEGGETWGCLNDKRFSRQMPIPGQTIKIEAYMFASKNTEAEAFCAATKCRQEGTQALRREFG